MEACVSVIRSSPQLGQKRDRPATQNTEQEDDQVIRDLVRRKTSLEDDGHQSDHCFEGFHSHWWLHSCPLDEDEDSQKDAQEEPGILEDVSLNCDEALTTQVTEETATQTPELCTCAIGTEARANSAAPAAGLPLFSLFRPKSQRKVLVVIRHGESEYNAAQSKAHVWADPKLFDPNLTAKGCQQARQLREHLVHELQNNKYITGKSSSALWVTSPLRRCLQTFLLSCPLLPMTASDNSTCSSQKPVPQQVQEKLAALQRQDLPPLRVVSHIAERVLTCGDIGTASSKLKTEFEPLQHCFEFDEEVWWHGGCSNNQESGNVRERESEENLKARITAAKLWLEQQAEQIVFLYGHSVFWKAFFAQQESLRNCEYKVVHW